jgi:hypothetical protein
MGQGDDRPSAPRNWQGTSQDLPEFPGHRFPAGSLAILAECIDTFVQSVQRAAPRGGFHGFG